jgi:hypothetical protein
MNENMMDDYYKEVNDLINSRSEFIVEFYPKVRSAYKNTYDWPELDPLRHEISICLVFGLCQAAITLTNHLLESLLKYSLIIHQTKNNRPAEKIGMVSGFIQHLTPARMQFGKQELGNNIDKSCSLGIITKEEKKALHVFRIHFRNAYSHSDKDKTFGDSTIGVQGVRLEDNQLKVEVPEIAKIAELIVGQGLVQAKLAQNDALPYFLEIDSLVRRIMTRIFTEHKTAG